ncbi:MAG: hypothetical protein E5X65_25730 [Mesorhizobium sp.]|nr:MAG: hypothetical protein E5X65_25730 [Mesorhizobium sp.]
MDDLTLDDVDKITDLLVENLGRLHESEAFDAVQQSKHWDFIRRGAITSATEDGLVVDKEDHDELKQSADRMAAEIEELRDARQDIADRLQEAIAERRTDDAIDMLRDIWPEHQFLSPAAEKMLAGIRGQGVLAL